MTLLTTNSRNSREQRNRVVIPCSGTSRIGFVRGVPRADVRCFAMFCAVGLSGVVIDFSVYSLLRLTQMAVPAATALAIWAAMTWNFRLNRHWTFAGRNTGSVFTQYLRFCLSCLTGGCVNWSVRVALWSLFPWFTSHELIAAGCGVAAGTFFNFGMCRLIVFNDSAPISSTDRRENNTVLLQTTHPTRRTSVPAGDG